MVLQSLQSPNSCSQWWFPLCREKIACPQHLNHPPSFGSDSCSPSTFLISNSITHFPVRGTGSPRWAMRPVQSVNSLLLGAPVSCEFILWGTRKTKCSRPSLLGFWARNWGRAWPKLSFLWTPRHYPHGHPPTGSAIRNSCRASQKSRGLGSITLFENPGKIKMNTCQDRFFGFFFK